MFTDLTPTRMEQELAILETPASDDLIRQWMDEQKLRLRKIRKVIPGGISPDRDAQFIPHAAINETSSKRWKLRVIRVARSPACLVGSSAMTCSMAARKSANAGW